MSLATVDSDSAQRQEAMIADGNIGQGTVDNESSVTVDSNIRLAFDSDKDIYNIGEGRVGNE